MTCVCIGPVSDNRETEMKIIFGNNVSASRVIGFVEKSAKMREDCGLISNQESFDMIQEIAEKLKLLNIV